MRRTAQADLVDTLRRVHKVGFLVGRLIYCLTAKAMNYCFIEPIVLYETSIHFPQSCDLNGTVIGDSKYTINSEWFDGDIV